MPCRQRNLSAITCPQSRQRPSKWLTNLPDNDRAHCVAQSLMFVSTRKCVQRNTADSAATGGGTTKRCDRRRDDWRRCGWDRRSWDGPDRCREGHGRDGWDLAALQPGRALGGLGGVAAAPGRRREGRGRDGQGPAAVTRKGAGRGVPGTAGVSSRDGRRQCDRCWDGQDGSEATGAELANAGTGDQDSRGHEGRHQWGTWPEGAWPGWPGLAALPPGRALGGVWSVGT